MGLYKYSALTAEGKKTGGYIAAESLENAKSRLSNRSVFVTSVQEFSGKKRGVLSDAMRLQFTRDIASLLRSGLPLYEALLAIEEKYAQSDVHDVFLDLCDQVKHGKNISDALASHQSSFDPVYTSMVRSGEKTGKLLEVFAHIQQLYERQYKLKKQLSNALLYPAFLGCFCLVVIGVLFFFLIPTMQDLFDGKQLHPITSIILAISNGVTRHWPSIAFSTVAGVGGITLFFRTSSGKRFFQEKMLTLPIIARITVASSLLKFSRVLSVLLESGVPLIEGLRLAKTVLKNGAFREAIDEAEEATLQGGSLAESLAGKPIFPPLFIRMLSVAEESGNLASMLASIADIYDEELERSLVRFSSMLQPVMLLFLGIVVGIVLLAVLLPLTDVSSVLN